MEQVNKQTPTTEITKSTINERIGWKHRSYQGEDESFKDYVKRLKKECTEINDFFKKESFK